MFRVTDRKGEEGMPTGALDPPFWGAPATGTARNDRFEFISKGKILRYAFLLP